MSTFGRWMRLTPAIVAVAAVLGACASTNDPGNDGPDDDAWTPPKSAPDPGRWPSPSARGRTVTGVLTFDDIEGGCVYLLAADGVRFQAIYPVGWSIDRATATLHGPGGVTAAAGDTVTVAGNVVTDPSSTCQVGPMFVVTQVDSVSR